MPAGLVIAVALTVYTLAANAIGIDQAQLRTGATLILTIVGLWVLDRALTAGDGAEGRRHRRDDDRARS